jgi:hypothetical protein
LAKVFEKIRFQADSPRVLGGRSVIYLETKQNGVQLGWTGRTVRGLLSGNPRGPGGQSAGSWRTVRPAQRALLIVVDFTFLPLEFKRGQSARASRTVREVRVFHIMASNGKREYIYSMLELGEPLLAL